MAPSTSEHLSKMESVKLYDLDEVKKHDNDDDCWVVMGKNVYDITPFLEKHPGGADLILREGGTDIGNILKDEDVHVHTKSAYNIMNEYKIGELSDVDVKAVSEVDINSNELVGWKEDIVDWNRGMVFQVHKFGREYIKWVHSPVNRTMKMFDNTFIEFFSNTRWYMIPLVWIPVTIMSFIFAYRDLASTDTIFDTKAFLVALPVFVFGLMVWTFLEYVLHRYLFHLEPNGDSPVQITIHFFFHGLHHKVPFDGGRLVFPPAISAILAGIYWALLDVLVTGGLKTAFFSGTIFGYICYDMCHYYIHHGNPSEGSYLHILKRYHTAHHFEDHENGFGISSKFWDIVFDTTLEIRKML